MGFLTPLAAAIPGVRDAVGGIFKGSSAEKASGYNPAHEAKVKAAEMRNTDTLKEAMNRLQSGEFTIQQARDFAQQGQGTAGLSVLNNMLATDGTTGSQLASEAVMNNPLFAGLLGRGGIQEQSQGRYGLLNTQADQDREALMGRDGSFGLQQGDLQAYGQASGNIGRMFGGMEQNLAQSLADRGLASAPSGAAGGAFSGLMGNKMEQLAKSQFDIAQARVNTAKELAMQRAANTAQQQNLNNNMIQNLGSLSQSAVSNQYGRQIAGAEYGANEDQAAITNALNAQINTQNVNNQQWAQEQASGWNPVKTFGSAWAGSAGSALGNPGGSSGGSGGGAGGAATSGMMASDERLKTNIEPGADAIRELLESLEAYSYDYKDSVHGAGKQIGVMAQDMEKVAPQLVKEMPYGKAIDYSKSGGIMMAALVELHKRLAQLEQKV